MAKGGGRKYNRDKKGRFASSGGTTRGSRLGGKRKTSENLGQRGLGTSAPKGTIARIGESRMMAGKNQRFAGKSSKAPAPAKSKTPSKMGKSAKNNKARQEYKDAARKVRSIDRARKMNGTFDPRTGAALGNARRDLYRTELKLSGNKKELRRLDKAIRVDRQVRQQMAATRVVANAKERAAGTVKGKIAAVKRFLTGSKRKRK